MARGRRIVRSDEQAFSARGHLHLDYKRDRTGRLPKLNQSRDADPEGPRPTPARSSRASRPPRLQLRARAAVPQQLAPPLARAAAPQCRSMHAFEPLAPLQRTSPARLQPEQLEVKPFSPACSAAGQLRTFQLSHVFSIYSRDVMNGPQARSTHGLLLPASTLNSPPAALRPVCTLSYLSRNELVRWIASGSGSLPCSSRSRSCALKATGLALWVHAPTTFGIYIRKLSVSDGLQHSALRMRCPRRSERVGCRRGRILGRAALAEKRPRYGSQRPHNQGVQLNDSAASWLHLEPV